MTVPDFQVCEDEGWGFLIVAKSVGNTQERTFHLLLMTILTLTNNLGIFTKTLSWPALLIKWWLLAKIKLHMVFTEQKDLFKNVCVRGERGGRGRDWLASKLQGSFYFCFSSREFQACATMSGSLHGSKGSELRSPYLCTSNRPA